MDSADLFFGFHVTPLRSREKKRSGTMKAQLFSTGEVSKLFSLGRDGVHNLIRGGFEPPQLRVGDNFAWTQDDVHRLANHLEMRDAQKGGAQC